MKIEVGKYVRTKSGGIGKIIEIDNSHIITDNETFGLGWDGEQVNWDFITEIVKSSTNIIDLIEVGDYVNGMKIIDTSSQHYKLVANLIDNNAKEGLKNVFINNEKDIKSIVTKEQFESIKYEV